MTMTGLQKVAQYVAHDTKGQGVPFDAPFLSNEPLKPERPAFRSAPPASPKADPNALAYRKAGPEPSWYQRNMVDLWKNRLAFRDMDAATFRDEIPIGVDNPVPWMNNFNYGKHNPFLYNMFVNPGHQPGQGHLGFGHAGGSGVRDQLLGSILPGAAPFAGPALTFNAMMGADIGGKLDEHDYRGAAQSGALLAVPYAGAAVGKQVVGSAAPWVTRLLTKSPEAIAKAKAVGEGVGSFAGMTTGIGAMTSHIRGKEWEEQRRNASLLADEVSRTKALGFSPA